MTDQTSLQKILNFFVTKIIIGIVVIAGSVVLTEWAGRALLDQTSLTDEWKNFTIAVADASIALMTYILFFRWYEKRRIKELSLTTLVKNASIGFLLGLLLQALIILILYLANGYSITHTNPVSFLLPAFTTALSAGFVAELLIRGVGFRLVEEKLGTITALIIFTLLFAALHSNSKGANFLSISATAMQAGLLLSSAYIVNRSLWLPIFLHFSWDFAEPGIFGAVNPGNNITESLFACKLEGAAILTGGQLGPQNSVQSLILCSATALVFLWIAKQRNNFIRPYWKK